MELIREFWIDAICKAEAEYMGKAGLVDVGLTDTRIGGRDWHISAKQPNNLVKHSCIAKSAPL